MAKRPPSPVASESAAELLDLNGKNSVAQLESLSQRLWTGVVRVRNDGAFGTVWLVKGHCVHATVKQGTANTSGWEALEQIARWTNGATLQEKGALPPERSIRLEQQDVWEKLKVHLDDSHHLAASGATGDGALDKGSPNRLKELRRLPGVVYLSTTHGRKVDSIGSLSGKSQSWVRKCLNAFSDKREVKRLVVENNRSILLMSKSGGLQTVVVARAGTDVQDLLNAVAEMTIHVASEHHMAAETDKGRQS